MNPRENFAQRVGPKVCPVIFTSILLVFTLFAVRCLAARPLGVDVSSYQGNSINWTSVKNSGITFAWAKATEGLTVNDSSFTVNEANARPAGVLIGAYHFAHPETHIGLAGADQEAAHFWSVASNYVKGSGYYLMPMLDVESDLSSASPAYTKATLSAWVNEWCNDIIGYAASNGVTVKPVVYTYTSYATTWLDNSVTNWPLWMASYPSSPNPQTGAPATSPWPNWYVWQYSSTVTVPGIPSPTNTDADVFNSGSYAIGSLVIGGLSAPYLITQPVNSLVTDTGGSVSFTATAGGTPPLYYQWSLNGSPVGGATNPTLTIASAQAAHTGSYALTVTNSGGSAASGAVSLIVYPPQVTVFSDNFDSNTAANWTVNTSSADTAVAFNYDYSALGIPAAPHSTNGTTRGLQMKANLTQGVVAAVSVSPNGQSFGGDYRLHFDGWINVNGPFPGGGASSTEYLIAGIGTAGNRVEWNGAGSTADGFYFTADGDGGVSASSTTTGDYSGYIGTAWQNAASGIYPAGSSDNGSAYYLAAFPAGAAAPVSQQSAYSQQTGNLAAGTLGLGWHDFIISRRGNVVNWSVDGILFAAISNATFVSNNVAVGFWDPVASLTDNTNLSFGMVDNLRVETPATAPVFAMNPASQMVRLGTNVQFTGLATGLPAPAYQWRFNGTNLPAATNSTFAITGVAVSNAGNYSLLASNIAGTAVSSNATLALTPPGAARFQSISLQPGGTVLLNFTGDAYWTYIIESSTNLTTWTTVINLASMNGVFSFNAGSATNASRLFFRARVSY